MHESPRRVDLRLTIPAAAPYSALAGEVAAKFAEYAGARADAAGRVAKAVQALAEDLGGDVSLTMTNDNSRLILTAEAGSRRKQTILQL